MDETLNLLVDRLQQLLTGFVTHLPNVAMAVGVLVVAWAAAALVDRFLIKLLERTNLRRSLRSLFRKLTRIGIWAVGIVAAAVVVFPSITPGKMVTALGLTSVAIGFAFKDIFENFLAGMLVLLREPFQIGDFIECDGHEGWVEEITIRDTRLRQTDGQPIVLPNAMLFKNPVTVRTDKDVRRVRLVCGVAYDEDIDRARKVIADAVAQCDLVDGARDIQVFASEFGASSIDFEIVFWTGSAPVDVRRSRDQVIARVKRALDEAGIEIPFPYRTLTFKDPLTLADTAEMTEDPAASEAA